MSIGPVLKNYQDVLHQQAGLTTTGDVWPSGCLNSRLGVPSGNGIIEKTAGGDLLRSDRDYLRPVRIVDFGNGWNRQ